MCAFFMCFRFIGNTVAVVATKPIEKGEEINNCYGNGIQYSG